MTYIPLRKPKKAMIYMLALSAVALSMTALATFGGLYKWIWQALALICLVLFIQSATRYCIYRYRYILTDSDFEVIQQSGRRETVLCSLDLSTGIALYTKREFRDGKKKIGHLKTSYNYTQNFMSNDKMYYVFEFNGAKCCVAFEADKAFADEFKKRIPERE